MINLLPDIDKQGIQAARTNVVLLRYNILTLVAIICLGIICGAFYTVLNMDHASSQAKSQENATQLAKYSAVRKNAEEYKANLTVADKILGSSVNYTSVVFAITKLLPQGVVFDSITLSPTSFGQQTTFSAYAKSYAQATQLKDNFQKSDMFTNVYFVNISDSTNATTSNYPYAVQLSAKLNKVATP